MHIAVTFLFMWCLLLVCATDKFDPKTPCIPLKNCPYGMSLINTAKYAPETLKTLRKLHCGYTRNDGPFIRCPQEAPGPQPILNNCVTFDGKDGVCKNISSCKSLLNTNLRPEDIDTCKDYLEVDGVIQVCCHESDLKGFEHQKPRGYRPILILPEDSTLIKVHVESTDKLPPEPPTDISCVTVDGKNGVCKHLKDCKQIFGNKVLHHDADECNNNIFTEISNMKICCYETPNFKIREIMAPPSEEHVKFLNDINEETMQTDNVQFTIITEQPPTVATKSSNDNNVKIRFAHAPLKIDDKNISSITYCENCTNPVDPKGSLINNNLESKSKGVISNPINPKEFPVDENPENIIKHSSPHIQEEKNINDASHETARNPKNLNKSPVDINPESKIVYISHQKVENIILFTSPYQSANNPLNPKESSIFNTLKNKIVPITFPEGDDISLFVSTVGKHKETGKETGVIDFRSALFNHEDESTNNNNTEANVNKNHSGIPLRQSTQTNLSDEGNPHKSETEIIHSIPSTNSRFEKILFPHFRSPKNRFEDNSQYSPHPNNFHRPLFYPPPFYSRHNFPPENNFYPKNNFNTENRDAEFLNDDHFPNFPENRGPNFNLEPSDSFFRCGTETRIVSSRIIGGLPVALGEYPWMVLIQYLGRNQPINGCGGSLITSKTVLTAAHCVDETILRKRNIRIYRVILGEYNTNSKPDCVDRPSDRVCAEESRIYDILRIIKHPEFNHVNALNDLAIIELQREVQFSDFIKPICLPSRDLKYNINDSVIIAGWGRTQTEGSYSSILNKAVLPIVEKESCNQRGVNLSKGQLCLGLGNGIDTCTGDSGGPMMIQRIENSDLITYQFGIISYGFASEVCGKAPSVNTFVPYYLDWIYQILEDID